MNTEQLIDRLSGDVRPVRRGAVGRRLALGVAGGAIVSLLLVALLLDFRADLWLAMQGPSFWIKWSYSLSLSACAILATARLARPDPGSLRGFWPIVIPILVLAGIGIGEMIRTPPGEWLDMWLGETWQQCPWLVLGLAVPIFIGLLWSFRKLAPTRLRAAGAAAGLSAGAFAATIYCVHCPESSAIFVLTWYSLGILLAATLGALIGPRVLRW